MSASDQELLDIKRRAAAQLLRLPGVHRVAIGGKRTGGKPTGQLCIKIYLTRKRPDTDIPVAELIPTSFEGVPTDVEQSAIPITFADPVPGKRNLGGLPYSWRYRPLLGGVQMTSRRISNPGTLGFLARATLVGERGGESLIVAVTCAHVLGVHERGWITRDEEPLPVGQPRAVTSCLGCCDNVIGAFSYEMVVWGDTFRWGAFNLNLDYAVAALNPGLTYLAEIRKIGPVANKHTITLEQAGRGSYQVRKVGRSTGLTGGIVDSIAGQGETNTRDYDNAIVIKANPAGSKTDTHFATIGDSGSAIVNDDNEIVGLLFAGSPPENSDPPIGDGVAIPFQLIEDDLQQKNILLQLETARTDGEIRTVPGNGKTAESRARNARHQGGQGPEATWQRLSSDLQDSARGQVLLDLYQKHVDEVSDLIRRNRAVASAWHHNSLPSLVQALHHALDDPTAPLPARPRGRSWSRAIDQVVQAFGRHGSSALRADARHYRDMIPELDSATYEQWLASLRHLDH